jgi:hypothetical protein
VFIARNIPERQARDLPTLMARNLQFYREQCRALV